ncbi:hypothetical protein [Methylogaea oryzae]|uniref:hypothetical protein n=1 Tax=Methylogaea oryzae TaxID=1295382 RepID=UPI001C7F8DE7|nr:hypothetical protein [Methylogaea oryzae]
MTGVNFMMLYSVISVDEEIAEVSESVKPHRQKRATAGVWIRSLNGYDKSCLMNLAGRRRFAPAMRAICDDVGQRLAPAPRGCAGRFLLNAFKTMA